MKNVFSAFLCLVVSLATAQELSKFGVKDGTAGTGLKVGDVAPDFELKDADGESFKLYDALNDGDVVVVFYRGAWCPVCTKYLSNFTDSLPKIIAAGANTVFISPNRTDKLSETKEKTDGKLILLEDNGYKAMDAYKVSFEVTEKYKNMFKNYTGESVAEMNDSKIEKLPVPATFIVGKDKKVKFVQFDYNYSNRASVKEIIDNI